MRPQQSQQTTQPSRRNWTTTLKSFCRTNLQHHRAHRRRHLLYNGRTHQPLPHHSPHRHTNQEPPLRAAVAPMQVVEQGPAVTRMTTDDDSDDDGANGDVDFNPPAPPYADIYGDHSSASSDEFADALSTPMRTANVDGSDSDTERTLIKAEGDEQEPDLEFEDMPGLDLDDDRVRELLEDPDPAPPRPPRGAAAPLAPRIPDRVTPPRAPPPISPNHGRGRARPVLPPREPRAPAQRAPVVLRPPRLFLPPVENQEEGEQGLEAGGPTRRAAAAGRAGPPAQILPPAAPLRGNDPAPGAVPDAPHGGQQVEAGQEEVPAPRLSAQQRDYLALREERAQRAVARAQQADDRAVRAARRRGAAQGDQEEIEEEEEPPAPDGLAQEGQD